MSRVHAKPQPSDHPSQSGDCSDSLPAGASCPAGQACTCESLKSLCDLPQYSWLSDSCQVTCGRCGNDQSTSPIRRSPSPRRRRSSSPSPPPAHATTSSSWSEDALNAHNAYRCRHSVPLLEWDAEIAAAVNAYASNLSSSPVAIAPQNYRTNVRGFSYLGSNWYGSSGAPCSGVDATNMWYGEITKTPDGEGLCPSESDCMNSLQYSEVVWWNISAVGCAPRSFSSGGCMVECWYGAKSGLLNPNLLGSFGTQVTAVSKSDSACQQ